MVGAFNLDAIRAAGLARRRNRAGARQELTRKSREAPLHFARFDAKSCQFVEEEGDFGTRKSFDASKHPRGQPGNAGQFGPGGGSKKPAKGKPAAKKPGGGSADQPTKRPSELPVPDRPTGPEPTRQTSGDAALQERREVSAATPASAAEKSPLHKAMERSPVKRADNLSTGINETSLLTLQDGTQAVFKPQKGESIDLRSGVPPRSQYRREIATSRVADALGFGDLVPATTVRNQGGDIGSAQAYVGGADDAAHADEPFDSPKDAARAAAFDYLIGNLDRHQGNWLVKDGKLVLIDNGLSLPTSYHENDFFNMEFWKNAVKEDLSLPDLSAHKGKWPEVEKELKSTGVEDEAIALMKERFEALTESSGMKIADLPSLLEDDDLRDMVERYDLAARRRGRADVR